MKPLLLFEGGYASVVKDCIEHIYAGGAAEMNRSFCSNAIL